MDEVDENSNEIYPDNAGDNARFRRNMEKYNSFRNQFRSVLRLGLESNDTYEYNDDDDDDDDDDDNNNADSTTIYDKLGKQLRAEINQLDEIQQMKVHQIEQMKSYIERAENRPENYMKIQKSGGPTGTKYNTSSLAKNNSTHRVKKPVIVPTKFPNNEYTYVRGKTPYPYTEPEMMKDNSINSSVKGKVSSPTIKKKTHFLETSPEKKYSYTFFETDDKSLTAGHFCKNDWNVKEMSSFFVKQNSSSLPKTKKTYVPTAVDLNVFAKPVGLPPKSKPKMSPITATSPDGKCFTKSENTFISASNVKSVDSTEIMDKKSIASVPKKDPPAVVKKMPVSYLLSSGPLSQIKSLPETSTNDKNGTPKSSFVTKTDSLVNRDE